MTTMPKTRGECVDGPRPCPHRTCVYHLLVDWPEATESCALDVADRGEHDGTQLSGILGISKQGIYHRQFDAETRFLTNWRKLYGPHDFDREAKGGGAEVFGDGADLFAALGSE